MKILVELRNLSTGSIAIAEVEIPGDSVNLEKLLASIPTGYEYCTYWVVEPTVTKVETLRY